MSSNRVKGRRRFERNRRLAIATPLCVRCERLGRVTEAAEWDHIVPLFLGGADDETNLQGLCADCHKEKTAEDRGASRAVGVDGWPLQRPRNARSEHAKTGVQGVDS